ncbi:MAG: heavy metal translocating P-type ATPase, partial [Actinobacteria bacterium]|nr:heavy metal translocating P-type ATPase [Actinomycetota bacterium]
MTAQLEQVLNALDGVRASVNFATETARITLEDGVTTQQLVAQVEQVGYRARLLADTTPEMLDKETNDRVAMLRTRLSVSLIAGIPVTALSMIPALHFSNWKWWALALSLP